MATARGVSVVRGQLMAWFVAVFLLLPRFCRNSLVVTALDRKVYSNRTRSGDKGDNSLYKTIAYVSSQDGIDLYDFDEGTGTITRTQSYYPDIEGGAGPLASYDSKPQLLYASFRQAQEIHTLEVNPFDARFTLLATTRDFNNTVHISVDQSRSYLMGASYGAGAVGVHRLESDGRLKERRGDDSERSIARVTPSASCAHMVQQVSGGFVLVPHTCGNRIGVFRLGGGGALSLVHWVEGGIGTVGFLFSRPRGPRHLVAHPISKEWIYVANELDSSVTLYALNDKNGQMVEVHTWSTVPTDFTYMIQNSLGLNTVSQIHMTPDGRFLYVSNRGHNSIAAFMVESTGRLQRIGIYSTEQTPRAFGISPGGQFLLVAGQDSGRLSTYRVGVGGQLSRIGRSNDVGRRPVWVEFARLRQRGRGTSKSNQGRQG